MEAIEKLWGAGGSQLVVGVGPTAVKTGFAAFAAKVRVAGTQIKSYNHYVNSASATVIDESWESVALVLGDYISFPYPVTSVTLNSASDSLMLYLVPFKED